MTITPGVVPAASGGVPPVVEARIEAGVAVLAVSGRLDVEALSSLRLAIDQLLRRRPLYLIVDCRRSVPDESSVAVLSVIRRISARHGIQLRLAGVPTPVLEALTAEPDGASYPLVQSATVAVEAAVRELASGRRAPRR